MSPTSYQAAPPRVNELKVRPYTGKSRKGADRSRGRPTVEARGTAPRSMPSIDWRHYVRSPLVKVSGRWSAGHPRPDKSPKISPTAGRRSDRLAQICDTSENAPGGLPQRQGAQPKLRGQSQVVVGFCVFSRVFYQDPEYLG